MVPCAETALVGNESLVGIARLRGGGTTSSRAVADTPGNAYRLNVLLLSEEFYRPALRPIGRRQSLLVQRPDRAFWKSAF